MTYMDVLRMPPAVTPETAFFWTAAADGRLEILRCRACGFWLHPPAPVCRECLSLNLAPEQVSGFGHVYSFTVNHQVWNPVMPPPYVIGIVELDEQPGLRLTTNIVGIDPEDVHCGLAVKALFEPDDEEAGYVLFVPADTDTGSA